MITCKYCSSNTVVKDGKIKGTQLYLCKLCKHKFVDNGNTFGKMRTPSHVIVTALNLYFDGLSVRKVSNHINEIFGEKSSQVTVWNWIQKYSKLCSEYVKTLEPKLSGKYHHDETEIKIDGSGRYIWKTLDEDTRFIVAHMVSNGRSTDNAIEIFKQALEKQRPISFFTDGSFAYNDAFNKVFYTRFKTGKVEWVRRVGIKARETNHIVERLHGTFKDRYKPMRGLKKDNTAKNMIDGYVTYYNFVRKHQSIQKTPAQEAGLEVKGWKQLIENAQKQKSITKPQSELQVKAKIKR